MTETQNPADAADAAARPATDRVAAGRNPAHTRSHNRRVILELLRRNGPMGRKALAGLARISTQAVGNIIEDLLAEGLLQDLGRLRRGRGLPPIQYALNPDGAITIGVEISVDELTLAVLDLGGNLRHEDHLALTDARPEAVLDRIAGIVADLRTQFPQQLMGIGVVMPGPFEIEGLSGIGPTTLPGWTHVAVAPVLSAACGVPVFIDNDANAAAVGELLFGKGRDVTNFCLVYFGAGIGMGAIVGGQPLRGAFGNAGEIGHVVVDPGGRLCQCGQSGCLERYASRHALSEALTEVGLGTSLNDLRALQANGDPALARWCEAAAPHLATMIGLIENIFDPQTVIVGGKLPGALLDDLVARLRIPASVANRRNRALPRVQRGQTGQASAALGAAALPFFDAITPQLHATADGPQPRPQT